MALSPAETDCVLIDLEIEVPPYPRVTVHLPRHRGQPAWASNADALRRLTNFYDELRPGNKEAGCWLHEEEAQALSDRSKIEWTDATWNPVSGCTKVSSGCDNCYAERITERFHGKGSFEEIKLHPERLDQPLRWKKPRMVFVNSMSDLFHPKIPEDFIAQVFAVMADAQQHIFQILTKRPRRMRGLLARESFWDWVQEDVEEHGSGRELPAWNMAGEFDFDGLANVWLGVSVEDQKRADLRIPMLLETPAAVRFLSCEPLLGPVDLDHYLYVMKVVQELREGAATLYRAGKKLTGRTLDGRTWDEFPSKVGAAP